MDSHLRGIWTSQPESFSFHDPACTTLEQFVHELIHDCSTSPIHYGQNLHHALSTAYYYYYYYYYYY